MKIQTLSIIAVLASMSKPFGLFYYRVGICFSRKQLPTLYPNKWFKNILSITIAEALLDKFGIGHFYKKYLPVQKEAITKLSKEAGITVYPSDILLLANYPDEGLSHAQKEKLSQYLRGDIYRFCLTPYFLGNHP